MKADTTTDKRIILGIGAATWDHLYVVKEFPGEEGVAQASANTFAGGGPVATALCVLAAAGHPSVLLDGQGDDRIGEAIRADMRQRGVDTASIQVQPGASSAHAVVLVRERDAARHITFFPASASALSATDVDESLVAKVALLHINGRHEDAARQAVAFAKRHRVPVSFDGGAGRYRESIRDLVLGSEIRILAREFAQAFTGETEINAMAAALLDEVAEIVVITCGTEGSYGWTREGESHFQPAFTATPLIDTTGCGDVYHGAFLAAFREGHPLPHCMEHASQLAARTAEGLGGRYALSGCSG